RILIVPFHLPVFPREGMCYRLCKAHRVGSILHPAAWGHLLPWLCIEVGGCWLAWPKQLVRSSLLTFTWGDSAWLPPPPNPPV
ncbi:hypothetical protein XENOCAPTIV_030409, partial [Xenoophorus captivus]